MGTKSKRNRLETKVNYQRQAISRLEDGLRVAHEARSKLQVELAEVRARAKEDLDYQKSKVSRRDMQIAELKGSKGVTV